jgi:hypothetical protein
VGRNSGQSVEDAEGRGLSTLGVPCGFHELHQTLRVHTGLLKEPLQVHHVKLALLKAADAIDHLAQTLPCVTGQPADLLALLLMGMLVSTGQAAGSRPAAGRASFPKALALDQAIAADQPKSETLDSRCVLADK